MPGEGSAATLPSVRERRIYRSPWRIDLTVREGVSRLVPASQLACLAAAALEAATSPVVDRPFVTASLGLILSHDRELAELNERHLGKGGPTDVLSFPLLPPEAFPRHEGRAATQPRETSADFALPPGARLHLGDVVVSVERAIAHAEAGRGGWTGEIRWSPADELRLLVLHGTLHVCGWDHAEPVERAAMRGLEARILGIEPPR